MSHIAAQFDRD